MNIAINVNTSVRTIAQNSFVSRAVPFVLPIPELRILALLLAILLSALAFVYSKDLGRRLFIDVQKQQKISQQLEITKGELMLEISALTTPTRIQQLAKRNNDMEMPQSEEVIVIN